jgi:L-asparaginase II
VASPLIALTEVVRSGKVESVHLGAAIVADGDGQIVAQAGPGELASYLRSAAKPVQLLAMLESGLEREVTLTGEELAVCAASHGGEPGHVAAVRRLLARAGLDESLLRCGAAEPLDAEARAELVRAGTAPGAVHNNCSGKHAAMLICCAANGWPLDTYLAPTHPLQERIAGRVRDLAGAEPAIGIDGCGVPTFYLSLEAAAVMTARLMASAVRDGPAARIVAAMTGHPWFTSGSRRLAFALMRSVPGVLAKEGAEGFFVVGLPAERSVWGRPVALALKVADGAGEDARGREPAVIRAVLDIAALSDDERERLEPLASPPLYNAAGRIVGVVRGVLKL